MKTGLTLVLPSLMLLLCCCPSTAFAQPALTEPGWRLVKTTNLSNGMAVAFNSFDENVYAAPRIGGQVVRWEADGNLSSIATMSAVSGMAFDPRDGDLFSADDFPGVIRRAAYNGGSYGPVENWVTGFGSGDADTAGIALSLRVPF